MHNFPMVSRGYGVNGYGYGHVQNRHECGCECECKQMPKEEIFRAELIFANLSDAEWNSHHMAIVSKFLHDHFVEHPGSMDFNIG